MDEDHEPVDVRPEWRASDFPPNIVDMDPDATAAATVDHDAREDLVDDDDDDADVAARRASTAPPPRSRSPAPGQDHGQGVENLAILLGACLGAAYEVAILHPPQL